MYVYIYKYIYYKDGGYDLREYLKRGDKAPAAYLTKGVIWFLDGAGVTYVAVCTS